ncbi:hypothetical protein RDI58_027766 [Solanum bulbocastanum]|uniref:Uncharacterized protein n=1 Tax=Solanum bulbocastanum TaxID=147425 RepID=A0AAN8SW11_SOLBU
MTDVLSAELDDLFLLEVYVKCFLVQKLYEK